MYYTCMCIMVMFFYVKQCVHYSLYEECDLSHDTIVV